MARQVLQLAADTSDISELQEDKEAPWVLEQTGLGTHNSHCQWGTKGQEPSAALQIKGELLHGDAKTPLSPDWFGFL